MPKEWTDRLIRELGTARAREWEAVAGQAAFDPLDPKSPTIERATLALFKVYASKLPHFIGENKEAKDLLGFITMAQNHLYVVDGDIWATELLAGDETPVGNPAYEVHLGTRRALLQILEDMTALYLQWVMEHKKDCQN